MPSPKAIAAELRARALIVEMEGVAQQMRHDTEFGDFWCSDYAGWMRELREKLDEQLAILDAEKPQ